MPKRKNWLMFDFQFDPLSSFHHSPVFSSFWFQPEEMPHLFLDPKPIFAFQWPCSSLKFFISGDRNFFVCLSNCWHSVDLVEIYDIFLGQLWALCFVYLQVTRCSPWLITCVRVEIFSPLFALFLSAFFTILQILIT